MTRGLRRFLLPAAGGRRLALAALVLAAGLVAALASTPPASAAAPASDPWIYHQGPAHLGFQLYWVDDFPDVRDVSVTGYDVQYREMGAMTWLSWSHSGTVRAVEFSNLTAGTEYQVRVRGTNSDGNGPWSHIEDVSAVVSLATTVNPPFPLQVEPGDAQARVSWGRPSHTGGQTLTGYVVRLYNASDPTTQLRRIEISDAGATSTLITNLTNGRDYLIDIFATAGQDHEGGRSAPVPFTPLGTTRTTGVDISTDTLTVTEGDSDTFTVALTDNPGSDVTATLVKAQYNQSNVGQPGHVWDINAATVSPPTLTYTSGSSGNWSTAQTVTVTALEDDDSCHEQLVVLVLVQTAPGSGNTNPSYEPVGGSGNAVIGVYVIITDDDGGACGGI